MKTLEKIISHAETSEKSVERYLAERVKDLGGICLKYNNPGMVGYPDRVCLLPEGLTLWVELKGKDGRLKVIQQKRIDQIARIGHAVFVCDSKAAVDRMLDLCNTCKR